MRGANDAALTKPARDGVAQTSKHSQNSSCLSKIFCIPFLNQGHLQERWWNGADSWGSFAPQVVSSFSGRIVLKPDLQSICSPSHAASVRYPRLLQKLPGPGSCRPLPPRRSTLSPLLAFPSTATSLWQGDLKRGDNQPSDSKARLFECASFMSIPVFLK